MGKREEPPPTYGPTALATPANFVTVARILATPVFVLLIATQESSWLTFAIGFVIKRGHLDARGRQGHFGDLF